MSRPLPFEVRAAIVELVINQYSYFTASSSVFHTSYLLCAIFHSLAYQLLLDLSNQTINSKVLACEADTPPLKYIFVPYISKRFLAKSFLNNYPRDDNT